MLQFHASVKVRFESIFAWPLEGNKRTARTAHNIVRAPRARFWVAVLRTSG